MAETGPSRVRSSSDDSIPCQIEESVFLGSKAAAMNQIGLKTLNITHVLTLSGSIPPPFPNDFKYKVIRVADKEDVNIAQYFDECIDFIEEAKRMNGKVLVHCHAGVSRSVTIVLAYLMKMWGLSLNEALNHAILKRPKVHPNHGFMNQLRQFEISLLDGLAGNNSNDEAANLDSNYKF